MNHRYVLDRIEPLSSTPEPRCLDYGCGAGNVVVEGRARGLDFYGVEAFYAGSDIRGRVEQRGLLGTTVRELENGHIPFPDAHFDIVVSNQVFEHIEDLDEAIAEIHRVLTPGGRLLSLFPCKEVLREGHCGIPLVHWLPKGRTYRYPYLLGLRRLGLGHHKQDKSPEQWATDFNEWLDAYAYYRTTRQLMSLMGRYFENVHTMEDDYVAYRLRDRRLDSAARATLAPGLRSISKIACRLLGSMVLVAEKA